ncbi:MAG: caspase family protein [Acidimicrobiia bacterium]
MGHRGVCVAVLALIAPLQLLAVTATHEDPSPPAAADAPGELPLRPRADVVPPVPAAIFASATPPAGTPVLVTEPDAPTGPPDPVPPPAPAAPATFTERFPAQAAAVQDPSRPATTRWALLIGINEHRGTVADNIGSRQDAEDLRAHLLASGWRDDHILLLTDRHATRANIVDGIAWLAARTDQHSVGIFHYSGHSKKWQRRDVDGDGERTDEGLWPSDDRYIPDGELVRLLDPVRPGALWISFATCNAAGMADPGLDQPHRILTFSSGEPQKSYEHPNWGNSVWGWLMIEQAFGAGAGDGNGDGRVTVEEAFEWARPRAHDTTAGQRYGAQDGVLVDLVPGDFDLLIPGEPRPPRRAPSEPAPEPAAPTQTTPDRGQQAAPPPQPTEEHQGNKICLLCGQ